MIGEDGKKYIGTKEAASLTGYSSDYIGQLSRKGFFPSTKVGRRLFVQEEGLMTYHELAKSGAPVSTPEAMYEAIALRESGVSSNDASEASVEVAPSSGELNTADVVSDDAAAARVEESSIESNDAPDDAPHEVGVADEVDERSSDADEISVTDSSSEENLATTKTTTDPIHLSLRLRHAHFRGAYR